MKLIKSTAILLISLLLSTLSIAQTADHTILVSNYSFTPAELTIVPGETVAFVNVEGLHNVNGITNTLSGDSFNNPEDFFIPEIEGVASGILMGEITFDQPGTYQYDCSIGFHAQLGMVGTIEVDAFTITDLLLTDTIPETNLPGLAFRLLLDSLLDSNGPLTLFIPNGSAVSEVQDLLNLNQFDLLGFVDLPSALEYHVATGLWLADDLEAGMSLPTVYGQDLTVSEVGGALKIDGASIISTNYLADNGVVHVIDKCLAPSGLPQATVWDIIKNSDDHQLLETAILNAYLDEELRAQNDLDPSLELPGPFTVFAPTDAAFEAYSQGLGITTAEVIAGQFVDEIVKTHIIGNKNDSSDFFNGQILQNYLGDYNQMTVNTNGIFVENIALQTIDIQAYNGVVHVIDEIITPNLPPIIGTCGTWTLVLQNSGNNGWGANFIEVEVNGEIISKETIESGNTKTFQFGVDFDSEVNLLYLGLSGASSQSYELYDNNNELIYSSIGISGTSTVPQSVYGLKACPKPKSCGVIEINMFDSYGDGWDFGNLAVFINDEFYITIPMPYGFSQKAFIPTDINDNLDFFYNGGAYQDENSFVIYDSDGELLASEANINQAPEDVTDLIVCENVTSITEQFTNLNTSIFPNPTSGELNINTDIEILRIGIFNIYGQKVFDATYDDNTIDISFLRNNTYLLEIETTKGLEFHKFSIIR
ncbi:MAG: fasciclin domain-containing protein [Saprospiraceae bacterium]|nr:fasciclin domain-containing protein [Saprospiraceae bacterium]